MLEDKLRNLRNEVPLLDKDLKDEIYRKSLKRRISTKSILLVLFVMMFAFFAGQMRSNMGDTIKYDFSKKYELVGGAYIKAEDIKSDEYDIFVISVNKVNFSELYIEKMIDEILEVRIDNAIVSKIEDGYKIALNDLEVKKIEIELVFKKGTFTDDVSELNDNVRFSVYTDKSEGDKEYVVYGFPKSKVSGGK